MEDKFSKIIQQSIIYQILILLTILIVGIVLYPINYQFFTHTISDIGAVSAYTYSVEIQPIKISN